MTTLPEIKAEIYWLAAGIEAPESYYRLIIVRTTASLLLRDVP